MKLLQELVSIRSASGDETNIKNFILNYVKQNCTNWKQIPTIHEGKGFQDAIILVFGKKPTTAIFAHTDTIGFTVGYDKNLIKIGGPRAIEGMQLVGKDSKGEIETELLIIENETEVKNYSMFLIEKIDRGTNLTFKPNFRETEEYIQSPYMDNRLGVWNALQVAETLENGAIVFSTYEEHGGGSVGFLGKFLIEKYDIHQALISDITWVTNGVRHGGGVAISMRDSGIPRRSYLNKIIAIAQKSEIKYQLEVESAGVLMEQCCKNTDLAFDWCFIGAPEDNVHTPEEKVFKFDIACMTELYKALMQEL